MDYLAAFGTKGVKADGIQLTGIPAGIRIGSIGNTGRSSGPYLDLITEKLDSSENTWTVKDPMLIYRALTEHDEWTWSKVYAGHQSNKVTTEMLKNFYNYNGGDMYPLLPAMNKEGFMTPEAIEWGIKRFALDNDITW